MEQQQIDQQLNALFQQRQDITRKINLLMQQKYQTYKGMSSEVKNDNPYSRLMALQTMGVVEKYDRIANFTVLIIGVGGVGSVVAEMLTRCGIGKLVLYDYDKVELANMNRLFFTPQQVGLEKVVAAKETLQFINPQICIEAHSKNITSNDGFDHLKDRILHSGLSHGRADLILSCVDNYSARMSINMLCNELDQNWIESGVSEDAMSSHIQIMIPGETACFACASPLAVIQENESNIKREGVCAASLPTTMGVTAAFMSQNVLKLLLEFGKLAYYLQYNAKVDFFQNSVIQPDPECKQKRCQELQKNKIQLGKQNGFLAKREELIRKQLEAQGMFKEVTHEENDWGIQLVSTNEKLGDEKQKQQNQHEQFVDQQKVQETSIEDLMKQLKQI